MNQPDFISDINFQNNQLVMFPEHVCPRTNMEKTLKFVVVMNHKDKLYYIARSQDLKVYMANLAYFMSGSPRYCASIELHRARTDKNASYWSVEVLEATATNVAAIRGTFPTGWRELGSKSHISRLGGADIVIYKVKHKHSGWSRHGSHKADKEPHAEYIAKQALSSLAEKNQRIRVTTTPTLIQRTDSVLAQRRSQRLDSLYRFIYADFEKDPSSWEIEIVQTITKEEESGVRPTDIIKNLNLANQQEWEESKFVNTWINTR